jgi:O-methyltransferase domain
MRRGLGARYHLLAGSALERDWGQGYDLVLMPNFLHHFDMPGCVGLLRRAHAALAPGGLLLAPEFVPAEDRASPPMAAQFSFVMLATTPAGNAYTQSEYRRMLAEAGFNATDFAPLPPSPQTLVIGRT